MIQSLHTAASGLRNQQLRIDTLGNNLANVNTAGYKSRSISFHDTLYTTMKGPEEGQREKQVRGTGLLPGTTRTDLTAGAVKETGNPLDLAILNDGYFQLEEPGGGRSFTRSGSFALSLEANGTYLVNDRGLYVLDAAGERINLGDRANEAEIAENGVITRADGSTVQLGVFTFANPAGLSSQDNTTFQVTENSGEAELSNVISLRGSSLESSNVDLGTELTQLIQAQRMYSLAGQALQTADDMEGLAINVRR